MKSQKGLVFVWAILAFSIMLSSTFAGTTSACTDTVTSRQDFARPQIFSHSVFKSNYSYFPSGDPDDGKFLTVTGHGLETLAGTMIVAYLGIPAGQTSYTLGIFDGDQGGLWDITTGSPDELLFAIYADPLKDGNVTAKVGQLSSFCMFDDDWYETTYPTGPDAMSPAGNYFYRVEMQWKDPALSNDSNSFKLRVDGQISLSMERFGFMGAPSGGCDPPVGTGDPNPGEINDPGANSYGGNWSFYFYLPHGVEQLTMREGDADCGNDTDSAETPNIDPDGTGPAQAEGVNPGCPADDTTCNAGCCVPGNIEYSIISPDGSVYTDQNPSGNMEWENYTIYDKLPAGIYEMRWMYADAHNAIYIQPPCEMYAEKEIPIPVENLPPVAEAGLDVNINQMDSVIFDGWMSYDTDGMIVDYFWDFGDGTTCAGMIVDHCYPMVGFYIVTLTVKDDDGATGSDTLTVQVYNLPPVAETGPDMSGNLFTNYIFNGNASYDPDGTIAIYYWEFGDGTTATGMIVNHAYLSKGIYTATLSIQDNDGATDSDSLKVNVGNIPPVAKSSPDASGTVFTDFKFDGSYSYDCDGVITAYSWNFGDGKTATGVVTSHMFSSRGVYTVTLVVQDNDGATSSDTTIVTIVNVPPVAIAPGDITTSKIAVFDGTLSIDPDGVIIDYIWDFGDGTTGTGSVTSHAYSANGIYIVTLTVQDNNGAVDSDTTTVYVSNIPPIAIPSYTTGFSALNGEDVTLTLRVAGTKYLQVSLTIQENGSNVSSVSITRQPGSPNEQERSCNVTMNSTTAYMAVISWSGDRNGDSPVWLLINNGVIDIRLKYNFNAQHDGTYATKTEDLNNLLGSAVNDSHYVKFDGSGSSDPDGYIVNYTWDFGDGMFGYGAIVTHYYPAAGIFSASLTVVDNDGSNNRAYFTVIVSDTFKNPDIGDGLSEGSDISQNVCGMWEAGGGETAAAILLLVLPVIGAFFGIISDVKQVKRSKKLKL